MMVISDFWHNFKHPCLSTQLRYLWDNLTLLCCLFISCVFEKVCLIWLWYNENMITLSCLLFSPVNLSAILFPLLSFIKLKFQLLFSLLGVSKTLPCPKNVTSLFIITLCKYHIPPEIFFSVNSLIVMKRCDISTTHSQPKILCYSYSKWNFYEASNQRSEHQANLTCR